ncbi:hypothetical protein [Stakelama tenebrarum]|uniref:Uncharacterized protein n=1 Tax=Stakelama tenebrarum TaxID=2711215 RepID=A0A6G6Y7S8_9SPHN|nr:hypothetical protein [Sphingosinithalassobacter tenebrarum]QIG80970.1 hypothetical protein G5C33_15020 [Sphingosinithalassobacter tenebrarum]
MRRRLPHFVLIGSALTALPGSALPADPQQARERVELGDRDYFTAGRYAAYASPWCADFDRSLRVGRDLVNRITLDRAAFPDNSRISVRAPDASPGAHGCGVYGYHFLAYGNYHAGRTQRPVPPRRVRDIAALDMAFAFTVAGPGEYNVLAEFYLTREPGSHRDQRAEIGWFLHPSPTSLAFARSETRLDDYLDGQGRRWQLYRADRFLMLFAADGGDVPQGTVDMKHLLDELVRRDLIEDGWWFNGAAIGVEPVRGESRLDLQRWHITYR